MTRRSRPVTARVRSRKHFSLFLQTPPGCRVLFLQLRRRALEDEPSAFRAGARAEVDDVVGGAYHVRVVLDGHDRVAARREAPEDAEQPVGVAWIEADGRLVEDVKRAGERVADGLSLIHISEPTRQAEISYAVFCLK